MDIGMLWEGVRRVKEIPALRQRYIDRKSMISRIDKRLMLLHSRSSSDANNTRDWSVLRKYSCDIVIVGSDTLN